MHARLENGIVREVVTFDPTGLFHPSLVWVPCHDGTAQGDLYDEATDTFSVPAPVLPTPEQIREAAKAARAEAVAAIKVTTAAGNTFDGDEVSQTRMVRAIVALQSAGAPSVTWVLADNSVIQATVPELAEALALAGAAQAAIWVLS